MGKLAWKRYTDLDADGWRNVGWKDGSYSVCQCGYWRYNDRLPEAGHACKCGRRLFRQPARGGRPPVEESAAEGKPAGRQCDWEKARREAPDFYKQATERGLVPVDVPVLDAGNAPGEYTNQALKAALDHKVKCDRGLKNAAAALQQAEATLQKRRLALEEAAMAAHQAKCGVDSLVALGACAPQTVAKEPVAPGNIAANIPELARWRAGLDWKKCSADPDICAKAEGMWEAIQKSNALQLEMAVQLDALVNDAASHGLSRGSVLGTDDVAGTDDGGEDTIMAGEGMGKGERLDSVCEDSPDAKRTKVAAAAGEREQAALHEKQGVEKATARTEELAAKALQAAAAKADAGPAGRSGSSK